MVVEFFACFPYNLPAMKPPKIFLASTSPRRAGLLDQLGLEFEVVPFSIDESYNKDEGPAEHVKRLALEKCQAVMDRGYNGLMLGADTVIELDGKVLGKPKDRVQAFGMLKTLAGRVHVVYSGLALYEPKEDIEIVEYAKTMVKLTALKNSETESYIKTREPLDKAGAYGIQGLGGALIEEIKGDYYNVVGLPLYLLRKMLKQLGYDIF